jgi:antitoxin (DNA-binding transcriptional repressor) of toxin-antitoxin stability system
MTVYTYSEARQRLAALLEQAAKGAEVRIRRKDGRVFVIKPAATAESPLDVASVALDVTTDEIVAYVREGRERFALPGQ